MRIYKTTPVNPSVKNSTNTSFITKAKVNNYVSSKLPNFTEFRGSARVPLPAPVQSEKILNATGSIRYPKAYIFIPFEKMDTDMIAQIISINKSRVLQDKMPYPIIFSGSEESIKNSYRTFIKERRKASPLKYFPSILYKKFSKYINKSNIDTLHTHRSKETEMIGDYLALKKMFFIPLNQINTSQLEKIYIIGHSSAGSSKLSSKSGSTKSIDKVSQDLKSIIEQATLPIDVRLLACSGADRETATSFDKETLLANSKILDGKSPLGQYMANAFAREGVSNVRVQAYHGLGIMQGNTYYHKSRTLKKDILNQVLKIERARDYRRDFFPRNSEYS